MLIARVQQVAYPGPPPALSKLVAERINLVLEITRNGDLPCTHLEVSLLNRKNFKCSLALLVVYGPFGYHKLVIVIYIYKKLARKIYCQSLQSKF